MLRRITTVSLLSLAAVGEASAHDADYAHSASRLQAVVEANIVATHAYQVNMALQSGKGDPNAWSVNGLATNELAALVKHQESLLASSPDAVRAWVRGRKSEFDPGKDLQPILASPLRATAANLPVNVFATFFSERSKQSDAGSRALASLLQMMTDGSRDGTQLQDLFALYVALGLPVHTAQAGLKESTDDEFLVLAKELAPALCVSPFDTDPITLRMLFRKLWNWGHRHTGERDKAVLARELLREPDVKALRPRMRAMPAQKIAVIGHSFTMNVHWSSPSAFVPVVAEMLARVNPKVEVRQWQAGGMNPSRDDCQAFYKEALAWKPDRVLLVVASRTPADTTALEELMAGFTKQGVEVAMFDTLYGDIRPITRYYWDEKVLAGFAARNLLKIVSAGAQIGAAPDKASFVSLDGVHMTEPYHRLMAKAWLRYLAGTAPKTE